MVDLATLTLEVNKLCSFAVKVREESYRITIEGDSLNQEIAEVLTELHTQLKTLNIDSPSFRSGTDFIDSEDRGDFTDFINEPWSITLGKGSLTDLLFSRQNDQKVIFLSINRFIDWVLDVDPFIKNSNFDPDFSEPTTIFVADLVQAYGGPSLWVVPLDSDVSKLSDIEDIDLPSSSKVHKLIHINSDCLMVVCPKGWVLTWGDLEQASAKAMAKLCAMVLSACLVQELNRVENKLQATLRGTKLISLPITKDIDVSSFLPTLIDAVLWVYDQRPETRLKLITDRLSIDIIPSHSLLEGMKESLAEALKQAVDSYSFVILDRKDAYHKEMRELMKDMKSQADLYAAKVRDLVSSLTRDVLGILVFLGFSFIGKFDQDKLDTILSSNQFSMFMKFMASYLMVSFLLQLVTHISDAHLSYNESTKWLKVLQNYTSREDNNTGFIEPIKNRRCALFTALFIIGFIYLLLALVVWNLAFVLKLLLAQ